MKKILLVEGNLREANQEFTANGIKTHTESLRESIDYFTNDLEIDSVNPSSDKNIFDIVKDFSGRFPIGLLFSKLSNFLAKLILNVGLTDHTNGFRIYSRRSVELIVKKCGKIGDGFIILSEIFFKVSSEILFCWSKAPLRAATSTKFEL